MKLRTQILVGFLVVFALLIINSGVMFLSVNSLIETEASVTRAHEVIATAHKVDKLHVDMETGERGFLIAGEEEFLEPFENADRQHDALIEELIRQVSGNPEQVARLKEIYALERKWHESAAEPEIAERKKVREGAVDADYLEKLLRKGTGKSILDEFRKQADRLDKLFEKAGDPEARFLVVSLVKLQVDMDAGQGGFLVTGAEVFLESYQEADKRVDKQFDELRSHISRTADPRKDNILRDINDLQDLHDEWRKKAGEPQIKARREMNQNAASLKTVAELIKKKNGKRLMDELRVKLEEFVDIEKTVLAQRKQDSRDAAWSSMVAVGIGTLLAIVCGLFAMGFVSRSVLRQVGGEPAVIADITKQIAQGQLDLEVPGDPQSSTGILASVRTMLSSLRQSKKTSDEQDWLKTGVARINEVMRGEQKIEELASKLISEICNYLDAKVGALYVIDEETPETPTLALLGSYAYKKRKSISNRFKLGEGLVGQAAVEKQQILVKNVPEEYVRVVSGLGEALPKFICVTPLLFEDRIKGVLEVGALAELSDIELEYLSQAVPAVAITFESAKRRADLGVALQKSEQLSKSLQTQQDQLKAANEELEEQTQALQRSEEKLRVQQEELEVVNEELEEKNRGLTQQKREVESAQEAIREKAEEIALASKYKSDFLANMSHELRTPLNSLLLLARSLRDNKDGNLTQEQVEAAGIIYGSGNDLLALINEILDLSKIEAGRMSVDIRTVTVQELCQSIKSSFEHMAMEKGLGFAVEVSEGTPARIETDSKRLQQVLKNLISNALKFTEEGRVDVIFHRPARSTDLSRSGLNWQKTIAISVKDTGIGISSAQSKVIFEAFQQADGSTSRKYGGTGLGLSISREIARLLGGEIQLASEPGQGSTFTLFVPRGPVKSGLQSPASSGPGASPATPASPAARVKAKVAEVADDRQDLAPGDRSILIIEDDAAFARTLVTICRKRRLKCIVAATGEDGLVLAREYQPDAVILDLKLPGIDGWQVLERIKGDTAIRHIPVHVISVEEPSTKAFRKGAIGHLHKPVTEEGLKMALEKLERTNTTNIKRLLVVEDDEDTRRGIVELVGGKDVEVDQASGANEAIEAILGRQYDCMILDLGLWDMDGEKLLEALAKDKNANLPPVIVYTGREISREQESRLREYTESIIIKSVRSEERLLDEVSLFLHRVVSDMPPTKRQVIIGLHDSDAMFQSKKVLIVEDDMRSAFALSKLLTEHGMNVFKVENGQKALELLDRQPDMDLVLMDIMMPVMDGYETTKRIRAQERFRELPIIALTAKAMKGDAEKCFNTGANDYLAKPVDEVRLFSMLRVWLYR